MLPCQDELPAAAQSSSSVQAAGRVSGWIRRQTPSRQVFLWRRIRQAMVTATNCMAALRQQDPKCSLNVPTSFPRCLPLHLQDGLLADACQKLHTWLNLCKDSCLTPGRERSMASCEPNSAEVWSSRQELWRLPAFGL